MSQRKLSGDTYNKVKRKGHHHIARYGDELSLECTGDISGCNQSLENNEKYDYYSVIEK